MNFFISFNKLWFRNRFFWESGELQIISLFRELRPLSIFEEWITQFSEKYLSVWAKFHFLALLHTLASWESPFEEIISSVMSIQLVGTSYYDNYILYTYSLHRVGCRILFNNFFQDLTIRLITLQFLTLTSIWFPSGINTNFHLSTAQSTNK